MTTGEARLAVACVLACTLVAVPPAAAGTRSKSATLTENRQTVTLKPKCPNGQRATGGGFSSDHDGFDTPSPLFFESRKAKQRAWRVSVAQSGDGSMAVTAYVYCDPDAPRTIQRSETTDIPAATGFHEAEAGCGGSGRAQAGGFRYPAIFAGSATGGPETFFGDIIESFRSGRKRWRSTAVAYGTGTPTLKTYVNCADAPSPKARSGDKSLLDNVATARSAPCPSDTHVAAGGFSQPDADFLLAYAFRPTEFRRSGRRWRTEMEHFSAGGTNASTVRSTAYCVA
jgi:hypothetical protein